MKETGNTLNDRLTQLFFNVRGKLRTSNSHVLVIILPNRDQVIKIYRFRLKKKYFLYKTSILVLYFIFFIFFGGGGGGGGGGANLDRENRERENLPIKSTLTRPFDSGLDLLHNYT